MPQKIMTVVLFVLLFQWIASDGWSSKRSSDLITQEEPFFTLSQSHCSLKLDGKFNTNFESYFNLILPERVTSLTLSSGFGAQSVNIVRPFICYLQNDNVLERVEVSGECIRNSDVLQALLQKRSLKHLHLNCKLDQYSGHEEFFSKALSLNETLESLTLDNYNLYLGTDTSPILAALKCNKILQTVHIIGENVFSVNDFNSSKATDLCQVLSENTTLTELELNDQGYNDEAVPLIIEALEHNPSLKRLNLINNTFTKDSKPLLEKWNARKKSIILFSIIND